MTNQRSAEIRCSHVAEAAEHDSRADADVANLRRKNLVRVNVDAAETDADESFAEHRKRHCRHVLFYISAYRPCPKKTKQICFCQNFVKFPPILIIFGRKMANDPDIYKVHSISTSPNLRHHLTVLNANVPNCYITLNVVICN